MGKVKTYLATYTDPSGVIIKKKIFKAKSLIEAKRQAQIFKKSILYQGPGKLKTSMGIIIIDQLPGPSKKDTRPGIIIIDG